MNIEELISPVIPVLHPEDTCSKALLLMEDHNLTHLPLVVNGEYLALVQEIDLMDCPDPDMLLSKTNLLNFKPAVFTTNHPYEALRISHNQNLSVIPVIENEGQYLGAITRDDLLNYIAEKSGLNEQGGILVLDVAPQDYSLREIARICESEEVVITNAVLNENVGTGHYEVTIKTNRTDLQGAISSLEANKYKVVQVYGQQVNQENIEDRYNLLMNYLNM